MALSLGTDLEDPRTQAILALGLGLLGSRGSFASSLSDAGQQAMGVYNAGRQRQDAEKTQALQRALLQNQVDSLPMQQEVARMQIEQQRREFANQQALAEAARRRVLSPQQAAMAGGGGPSPAAAAAGAAPGAQGGFDSAGFINDAFGIDPMKAMDIQAKLRKEAPKLKSIDPMRDPGTGKLVNVAVYEDGTTRIMPYGVRPEMIAIDAKNRSVMVDKNDISPGASVKYGASPDALLKYETDRDANNINRTAQRTQIVTLPGLGIYGVDKGTGTATPVTMAGTGQTMPDPDKVSSDKRNAQLLAGVQVAEDLLKQGPTGSYAGAAADTAARLFGASFKSGNLATRLELVGGWLTSNVPRMEGPQSNTDVVNYQIMAGVVGDRTRSPAERLDALKSLRLLLGKYQEVNGTLVPRGSPRLPQDTPASALGGESVDDIVNRYRSR